MKLDRIPKLNKIENQMTQLNESKVRGFEWILVILRRCNLHFSLNINILLLKYNMKYKDSNELFKYKIKVNLISMCVCVLEWWHVKLWDIKSLCDIILWDQLKVKGKNEKLNL